MDDWVVGLVATCKKPTTMMDRKLTLLEKDGHHSVKSTFSDVTTMTSNSEISENFLNFSPNDAPFQLNH